MSLPSGGDRSKILTILDFIIGPVFMLFICSEMSSSQSTYDTLLGPEVAELLGIWVNKSCLFSMLWLIFHTFADV
jgi:hypothetical protein